MAEYANVEKILHQLRKADFDKFADPTNELRAAIQATNSGWPLEAATHPALEDEVLLLRMMLEFCRNNSQVVIMDKHQPHPLPLNVIADMLWHSIQLPGDCVYLHWGLIRSVCLPADLAARRYGWDEPGAFATYLEGAFIRTTSWRALEVLLILRPLEEPATGRSSVEGVRRPPVVHFTFDKLTSWDTATRLPKCLASLADVWEPEGRFGDIPLGALLQVLQRRTTSKQVSQAQLIVGALQHILAALENGLYEGRVALPDLLGLSKIKRTKGPFLPYEGEAYGVIGQ
ncbi:hypothetical protein [Hymenobacter endophyticus]|uniref:hypothetical protein n=1 Tax=Hymenobacter endophyticus TaxID=3076335 RepID=UPI002905CA61|nr:hypothetical protein [Hymenobacter endophyticus]